MAFIVVTGDPVGGFEHIGPFTQPQFAAEWADEWLDTISWWIVPLLSEKEKENVQQENQLQHGQQHRDGNR